MLPSIVGYLGGGAPVSTNSYESIATVTVGSGGSSSISFSSIPTTYSHLQLRSIAQCSTSSSAWQRLVISFNSDTTGSHYDDHALLGNGSSASAFAETGSAKGFGQASQTGVGYFAGNITDILDYANTNKYKTSRTLTGQDGNAGGSGVIRFESNLWQSTSAITSITISIEDGSNFNIATQFALYGVK